MYVDGQLNHPVTLTVKPYSEWKQVSTGLDPVKGSTNTFTAPDFDRLYDCPILVGNQEVLTFDYKGIIHSIAIEKPGTCNRGKLTADLKRIVEAGTSIIGTHENIVGHEFQSVALSSRDTWMLFFNRNENSQSVTINYYNKGATLTMLLDLKIRYESQNMKSLDDVMRTLYQVYNKSKNRGFTDQEFREACELAAGCSLAEFFDYVYTTIPVDYAKYLSFAGLNIDLTPQEPAITHLDKSINKRSFKITTMENPTSLQKKVMEDWLR